MSTIVSGTNGLLRSTDYQTPTTGFSYTFPSSSQVVLLKPATTLLTGTITMPLAPSDGMTVTIASTQIITTLVVNGNTGQTVNNAITTLSAGGFASYLYRSADTSWYRVG
jgi:hypothetical protein